MLKPGNRRTLCQQFGRKVHNKSQRELLQIEAVFPEMIYHYKPITLLVLNKS